ncbi:MAG: hypothetical protein INR73_23100 [Williamsia sp.]|nr:hypothetical protein [Williamsia sp.]
MRVLFIAMMITCIYLSSCAKDQTGASKSCYKGRYIGSGCWPIVQVLESLDADFAKSHWQDRDSVYKNVFGVGYIPEKYKDGRSFYFTIDSVLQNPVHTMNCNTAGYFAVIKWYSDSSCAVVNP